VGFFIEFALYETAKRSTVKLTGFLFAAPSEGLRSDAKG
jgi:hypothetical protein